MNIVFVALGILTLGLIVLSVYTRILYRRITQLTQGKKAASLELIISENNNNIAELKTASDRHEQTLQDIQTDTLKNIQNIGVVRFNPFKETGGNQSFAIALTDKDNTGIILSSLYARERVNFFVKPITKGTSSYTLTKEEQQALNQSHQ